MGRGAVWDGGSRLYAPIGDQPRPLRPMRAEQGKADVLSPRRLGDAGRGVGQRAATGRPYETAAENVGRGGLWPPAMPTRHTLFVGRDVVLAKSAPLRPHKFRISRPALAGRSRSLHCSSFPHKAGQPCGVPLAGGHFSLRSLARPLPSPSQAAHPSSCRKRQASSAPLLRLSQRKAFRLPLGPPFRFAGLAWGP